MTNTINKTARIDQSIARLEEQKRKIAANQRKADNRRKFELGGLVIKAAIADYPSNELLGGLIHLRRLLEDPSQREKFANEGGRLFSKEQSAKVAMTLQLNEKPNPDAAKSLRAIGLRWNRIMAHWEGFADPEAAQSLVNQLGGSIKIVEKASS